MITKPLLASQIEDLSKLTFPVLCSPKLDGIRCLIIDGKPLSRSFKKIPNKYISTTLADLKLPILDGELISGSFNESSSAIMSFEGTPDFTYHIFDYVIDLNRPFKDRYSDLVAFGNNSGSDHIKIVEHTLIEDLDSLLELEGRYLELGYEGLMIRSLSGKYKCGRSSVKEGILLKLKRFYDSEAIVIGYEEKMTNMNEAKLDNFGNTKRASCKDGLVGADTLGSLLVRDIKTGIEYGVGSGFTEEDRKVIWAKRDQVLDRMITVKYQSAGMLDAPRFPVFKGFREGDDLC